MGLPRETRVVVTGGAGGLGRGFCVELGGRRARVVVADVNLAQAEETAHLVEREGGRAVATRCDVAVPEDVEALAKLAETTYGGTDLLINNAGVAAVGAMGEIPLEDWRWAVGVNLWGVIHGCHFFVPAMRTRGAGHVLNVASAAGLIAVPNAGPYSTTKAAVVALSETLYGELQPFGVGVTVLCPTFFQTGILEANRGANPRMREVAAKAMGNSRLQVGDVVCAAMKAVEGKHLYAVPMLDGKALWLLKRATPRIFHASMARIYPWIMK